MRIEEERRDVARLESGLRQELIHHRTNPLPRPLRHVRDVSVLALGSPSHTPRPHSGTAKASESSHRGDGQQQPSSRPQSMSREHTKSEEGVQADAPTIQGEREEGAESDARIGAEDTELGVQNDDDDPRQEVGREREERRLAATWSAAEEPVSHHDLVHLRHQLAEGRTKESTGSFYLFSFVSLSLSFFFSLSLSLPLLLCLFISISFFLCIFYKEKLWCFSGRVVANRRRMVV